MIRYTLSVLQKVDGVIVYLVTSIVGIALTYAVPYVNGSFLDFLLTNRSERGAIMFAFLVASIGVISALFTYCAGTLSIRIATKVSYELLKRLVLCYERVDYLDSRKVDSAYVTQRFFSDTNVVSTFVLSNIVNAPISVAAIPIVVAIIASIDLSLAAASILLLLVYLFVLSRLKESLYKVTYEKKEADSKFYAVVASQLNQKLNIQLFSVYQNSSEYLDGGFGEFLPKVLRSGKLSYSLTSMDGIFTAVFQAIILIIAGIKIINGNMTIGEYTIVVAYFAILFKTTKYINALFKSYQDAKASWKRISEIIHAEIDTKVNHDKLLAPKTITKVSVVNLSFSVTDLSGVTQKVLSNCTFEFSGPRAYCIVGENGKGKTSLLHVMAGIYRASGEIKYNDISIKEYDMDYVRGGLISCCPQLCCASDETVKSMLHFLGTPYGVSSRKLREIPLLDKGVDELLDKKCSALSGGELRRIYLWSAIARDSAVLLLDEPTTGLDILYREELTTYIRNNPNNQLIIVASHDSEVIGSSDVIVELTQGALITRES